MAAPLLRLRLGCTYSHSFSAAVEHTKKAFPFLKDRAPELVRKHAWWEEFDGNTDHKIKRAKVRTIYYAHVWFTDGEVKRNIELGHVLPHAHKLGWQQAETLPESWSAKIHKMFTWKIGYINITMLEGIFLKEYGELCPVCNVKSKPYKYKTCDSCHEEEYWSSHRPWIEDLPKLVRQLKKAARELS